MAELIGALVGGAIEGGIYVAHAAASQEKQTMDPRVTVNMRSSPSHSPRSGPSPYRSGSDQRTRAWTKERAPLILANEGALAPSAPGGPSAPASAPYSSAFLTSFEANNNSDPEGFSGPPPAQQLMTQSDVTRIMQFGEGEDDCSCFARGSLLRPAPKRIILDSRGRVSRINLLFKASNFCENTMFNTGLIENPPPELFDGRLSPSVFKQRMLQLRPFGLLRLSKCDLLGSAFLSLLVPCLCCWRCERNQKSVLSWNEALSKWQNSFNKEVLIPLGMYIKTQSRSLAHYSSDGKQRNTERWLAIAITQDAVNALMREPHLMGDIEGDACGTKADEHTLVMHP